MSKKIPKYRWNLRSRRIIAGYLCGRQEVSGLTKVGKRKVPDFTELGKYFTSPITHRAGAYLRFL